VAGSFKHQSPNLTQVYTSEWFRKLIDDYPIEMDFGASLIRALTSRANRGVQFARSNLLPVRTLVVKGTYGSVTGICERTFDV